MELINHTLAWCRGAIMNMEDAGHLFRVEKPEEFTQAICCFIEIL